MSDKQKHDTRKNERMDCPGALALICKRHYDCDLKVPVEVGDGLPACFKAWFEPGE